MSKVGESFKLQVTERHRVSFDKVQFTLYTRAKEVKGDGDGTYTPTYHPTIGNMLKHVLMDEFKEKLDAFDDVKELSDKFDELVANPHIERVNTVSKWFEGFVWLEDQSELKKENAMMKKKLTRYEKVVD